MSVRHTSRLIAAALVLAAAMAGTAGAKTILDAKGDTTYERVYFGYAGRARESLSDVLAGYTDAITGLPSPITNTDGTPIIVGNVDLGEDPAASDQTQIQRFFTDTDQSYELTYVGLGYAGYLNVMGYYTCEPGESEPADFDYVPLITQGVDDPGTKVAFDVPADHYFGLYLSADGGRSERNRFFSENAYNPDGAGAETDHMLAFHTNRGLLTYPGGEPIPEPATLALIGAGLALTAIRRRRR